MTVIDILFRLDDICKKYDKYDIEKQRDLNAHGDDAFARFYATVESEIDKALLVRKLSFFFPSIFIFVWISMTKCPIKWILCGLFCFNRFSILKMLWHYSLNLLLLTWLSTNSFKFCRKLKQHQWRPTGRLRLQWRQRFVGPRPDCWRKFLSCKNWRARR